MAEKSLENKAIDIKGKAYVLVSDRIIFFNENYPKGYIQTNLVSEPDAQVVVVKAKVVPNHEQPERFFTGYSQAKWGDGMVNKSAALENAETSAVGRALAMMGIGVIDSIASADEMNKAGATPQNDVMERYMTEAKTCQKCGAEMAKSSKGNWYCSALCWKKEQTPAKKQDTSYEDSLTEDVSNDVPF